MAIWRAYCPSWTFIHASDIGGGVPGSISPSFTEVFQEGLRMRPVRLVRGEAVVPEIRDIFLDNTRIPGDMWGDFRAMISALRGMEKRLLGLCDRYGTAVVRDGMRDVLDFAEQKARSVIAGVPDGTYAFSDYVELLKDGHYALIACELRIAGSTLEIDFTGSDPQVAAAYNFTTGDRTHPYLVQALVNFILSYQPDSPRNSGISERPSITLGAGVPPNISTKVGARSIASTSASHVVPRVASAPGEGSATIIGTRTEHSWNRSFSPSQWSPR